MLALSALGLSVRQTLAPYPARTRTLLPVADRPPEPKVLLCHILPTLMRDRPTAPDRP